MKLDTRSLSRALTTHEESAHEIVDPYPLPESCLRDVARRYDELTTNVGYVPDIPVGSVSVVLDGADALLAASALRKRALDLRDLAPMAEDVGHRRANLTEYADSLDRVAHALDPKGARA